MMETHSEHFLLEVLRAISDPECPLQDDDVSILYTYNTPEHGMVKRHTTTNGTLDERFREILLGITDSRSSRRIQYAGTLGGRTTGRFGEN